MTTDELRDLVDKDEYAFRFDAGMSSTSSLITISDKESIATSLGMHYVIFHAKAEIDQLKEGLRLLGVLDILLHNTDVMLPLFRAECIPLTATTLLGLFTINWSPATSDIRDTEEAVIVAWTEYIYSTEGNNSGTVSDYCLHRYFYFQEAGISS